MFTRKFNSNNESGDIIAYAKFFYMNNIKFTLLMESPDSWIATAMSDDLKATTSPASGPSVALQELYTLIKPILNENKNG